MFFSYLAFTLNKYVALEIFLNFFRSSYAFIALVWYFLQNTIWWVSSDQSIPAYIVIVYSN